MQSHTSLFTICDARMKAGLGSEGCGVEFLLSHSLCCCITIFMMKIYIVTHAIYQSSLEQHLFFLDV